MILTFVSFQKQLISEDIFSPASQCIPYYRKLDDTCN